MSTVFHKGQRVQLTDAGVKHFQHSNSHFNRRVFFDKDIRGTVTGGLSDPDMVYILVDGKPKTQLYARDFWRQEELPTIEGLRTLFIRVNQDDVANGGVFVPFTDFDFYSEQIQNLYGISDGEAIRLAKELVK